MDWNRKVEIKKLDDEQRLVFGWLSVAIDKSGTQVEDTDEHIIEPDDLEKAAYEFVLFSRRGDAMHEERGVGRLVESMMFTKEKAEMLGLAKGVLPECGWWVGFKVDDDATWAKVKSGEYGAFSIGGAAVLEEVDG